MDAIQYLILELHHHTMLPPALVGYNEASQLL
jgi:hypothetical protein